MSRRMIAVIGGGGKTTAMAELARQCPYDAVLATTTTHIFPMTAGQCRECLIDPTAEELTAALDKQGILCAGAASRQGKLKMLPETVLQAGIEQADCVIYEADGAFHHPIKIYKPDEPVMLPDTAFCLVVAGLSALGKPIEEAIFRYELNPAWAADPRQTVGTKEMLACIEASIKSSGMPEAQIKVLLNQADILEDSTPAEAIVRALRDMGIDARYGSLQQAPDFLWDWVLQ